MGGTHYTCGYDIALGPEGPWCALGEEPGWPDTPNTDWEWTDYTATIEVYPCEDRDAAVGVSMEALRYSNGRLQLIDQEPVIVAATEGGLIIQWVRFDRSEEIHVLDFGFLNERVRMARVGASLAILSTWDRYFPGAGGYWETKSLLGILHGETWRTGHLSDTSWGPPHSREGLGQDQDALLGYFESLDVGSDGLSRVYVPFVEDHDPKLEPADSAGGRALFSVATRPGIRVYEAATLDAMAEWTLGYDEIRETLPPSTQAAVTSNGEAVGFAIARSGFLDLWVLADESWYGPYPIASGIAGSADIAADDMGRYWIVWDDGLDVYATMVSPADLGLEEVPSAVTVLPVEVPSSPSLGQNSPNPFNTQTAIEAHVPPSVAGDMSLDIFNLRGQRVYSIALPAGSTRIIWNGTDEDGLPVASGAYLYRLLEGDRTWASRRMALIR